MVGNEPLAQLGQDVEKDSRYDISFRKPHASIHSLKLTIVMVTL